VDIGTSVFVSIVEIDARAVVNLMAAVVVAGGLDTTWLVRNDVNRNW